MTTSTGNFPARDIFRTDGARLGHHCSTGVLACVLAPSETPGRADEAPYSLSLRAFDTDDGRPKWSTPLGPSDVGGSLAAVANGLIYLTVHPAQGSDRLLAVDATSGTRRWIITPPAPGTGRVRLDLPVVDGPLVFVTATASDASELSAIDTTGRRVWSSVPGGQVFPGSNLAGSRLVR